MILSITYFLSYVVELRMQWEKVIIESFLDRSIHQSKLVKERSIKGGGVDHDPQLSQLLVFLFGKLGEATKPFEVRGG